MISFFRYPGGKAKLRSKILSELVANADGITEYREPFFGGGSIGLEFLSDESRCQKVWINDRDTALACLWTSVVRFPGLLKGLVSGFVPSVEAFDRIKSHLLSDIQFPTDSIEVTKLGFEKLAIHQISYSGLGTKSGGPLGGRKQQSPYKINCRWSPEYICKKIDRLHARLSKFEIHNKTCTNRDFVELIDADDSVLLYLDPPYYVKGGDLYQFAFSEEDHIRLMEQLRSCKAAWLLSYDDCKEIRHLYEWADVKDICVNYSITATKDKESGKRRSRSKSELMIQPRTNSTFRINCNYMLTKLRKINEKYDSEDDISLKPRVGEMCEPVPVEPEKVTRVLITKPRQCIRVEVRGEEYDKCEKMAQIFWSHGKTGEYGSGIVNSEEDPYKTERTGILGQMAVGKVFHEKVDLVYRKGGDEQDFLIAGKKWDVKCNTKKGRCTGYVYCRSESGRNITVDKDVYLWCYIEKDDRKSKSAVIILVGWSNNNDIKIDKPKLSPVWSCSHYNYEMPLWESRNILKLLDRKKSYDERIHIRGTGGLKSK